jgi:DNA-binding CsgD family transcriptional regulator
MSYHDVLTPLQLKCVNYVRSRKIPPNRKEVALYLKVSPSAANNLLRRLAFFGHLKSFTERGKSGQLERYYTFVSMTRIEHGRREKPKKNKLSTIFNDPFNLAGARA